jgi:hypothetical protein
VCARGGEEEGGEGGEGLGVPERGKVEGGGGEGGRDGRRLSCIIGYVIGCHKSKIRELWYALLLLQLCAFYTGFLGSKSSWRKKSILADRKRRGRVRIGVYGIPVVEL